jgi:hypothetical protein
VNEKVLSEALFRVAYRPVAPYNFVHVSFPQTDDGIIRSALRMGWDVSELSKNLIVPDSRSFRVMRVFSGPRIVCP